MKKKKFSRIKHIRQPHTHTHTKIDTVTTAT